MNNDKERLSNIEYDIENNCKKEQELTTELLYGDAVWLVEQIQELKQSDINCDYSRVETTGKIIELENQNTLYRRAIERAMKEMESLERYGNESAIVAYITLSKALEDME